MSLQSRLASFISAVGADIKALQSGISGLEIPLAYSIDGVQVVDTGELEIPITGGNYTIVGVSARLNTAPTGATTFKVDVNKNGTTIFTTQANRPIFTASAKAANSGTPDVTSLTTGDYLTVDVDAVGSTVAGSDLVVVIRIRKVA